MGRLAIRYVHEETMSALQAHDRLAELRAERAAAFDEGLHRLRAYMNDLDDEIATVRHAYVVAAVAEIATLHGQLFGRQIG